MTATEPRAGPAPEELEKYLRLTHADVARLVLCLLIEDALRRRLSELLPAAASPR